MVDNVAFTINLFGLTKDIYWYGIIIAFGMLLGIWIATYNARRRGYDSEMVLDIALIVVITAVIGARIHYVVFSWDYYKDSSFWEVFKIWHGGLAIYGGLVGGLLGLLGYSYFTKKRFLALADVVIPSLILGQAIGRWGNFVNQEAYGWVITNAKWCFFPAAVFISADSQFHMATFFYESMWNFAVFAFLMTYLKKNRQEGNVLFFYMVLYGFGRMIIESFRTDSQMLFSTGIRVNQLISLIIMLMGIALLLFRKNGQFAQAYKVKLFPETEGARKRREARQEREKKAADIANVSTELKIMGDEDRVKRLERIQREKELEALKEQQEAEEEQISEEASENNEITPEDTEL